VSLIAAMMRKLLLCCCGGAGHPVTNCVCCTDTYNPAGGDRQKLSVTVSGVVTPDTCTWIAAHSVALKWIAVPDMNLVNTAILLPGGTIGASLLCRYSATVTLATPAVLGFWDTETCDGDPYVTFTLTSLTREVDIECSIGGTRGMYLRIWLSGTRDDGDPASLTLFSRFTPAPNLCPPQVIDNDLTTADYDGLHFGSGGSATVEGHA
jgi:hypothetical protein